MLKTAAAALVFLSGFAIMVLEIIGARYLGKDFGSAFYVWISQIGVILIALALGYAVGGTLADRFRRVDFLALPLAVAGLFTVLIPTLTPAWIEALVTRHPPGADLPELWRKLDPVLGSTVVFFLPCFCLAILPPYMTRLASTRLAHVGAVSGLIYAASTVGGIAGVFVSGYVLIDQMRISQIFRATGALTLALAPLSLWMHQLWKRAAAPGPARAAQPGPSS